MEATPPDGQEPEQTPRSAQDDDAGLPPIVRVRTQATVRGNDAVVVRFETGARLRYVDAEDAVCEEWLPPDAAEPARTVERPDADRAEVALNAVGEYLTFDGRDRAAFVWGAENVELITG